MSISRCRTRRQWRTSGCRCFSSSASSKRRSATAGRRSISTRRRPARGVQAGSFGTGRSELTLMARRIFRSCSAALVLSLAMTTLDASPESDATLVNAVLRGDTATVQQLLKTGAPATATRGDGLTALHAAAIVGDRQTAETLIAAGADVNAPTTILGSTPLDMAAKNGHGAIVELLLKKGANANT